MIASREHLPRALALAFAEEALAISRADGAVLKTLARSVQESTSEVIAGALPAEPVRVLEEGATFLCDLDDGVSTGLFLDHREARLRVRALARDVEVLNLFSYTCAFSVHAALGGARRVTSVDVSKKALRRGRENMSASGQNADAHRWFADDVFAFLARQKKKGGGYGVVVADPPVFGRARGASFSLETALGALLHGCLAATAPGGTLVFSTHLLALDESRLAAEARAAASASGRTIAGIETMGLPAWDHPVPADHRLEGTEDRGNYLKTLVLRLG